MNKTPYDIVRDACVKANPEIAGRDFHITRLADVLLAMPFPTYLKTIGDYVRVTNGEGYQETWDLRNDSLEWHRDNRPEFVFRLAQLLSNN